jgi:hypothetical protein
VRHEAACACNLCAHPRPGARALCGKKLKAGKFPHIIAAGQQAFPHAAVGFKRHARLRGYVQARVRWAGLCSLAASARSALAVFCFLAASAHSVRRNCRGAGSSSRGLCLARAPAGTLPTLSCARFGMLLVCSGYTCACRRLFPESEFYTWRANFE